MMSVGQREKQKVCFFTLYSEIGASSKYRAIIFKDDLNKIYKTSWFNFWNDKYATKYINDKKKYALQIIFLYIASSIKRIYQLYFVAPKYDVVFIQKSIIPKIHHTFLGRIKKNHKKIIYDIDDAVYSNKSDNSDLIAEQADTLICGNDTLKKHYAHFCKNCKVLPTTDKTNDYVKYHSNTFDKKIIGWIGSKSTIDNLDIVVDAINHICDAHKNVTIKIICSDKYGYEKKFHNLSFAKWNIDSYVKELSKITVGIMPLKNTEFNKGKCGFKLIQYLSLKKPVVASNVGVNATIVDNCGFIANTEKDWENYLKKILFDKRCYNSMTKNIDESFFPHYHYDIVLDKLIDIINE